MTTEIKKACSRRLVALRPNITATDKVEAEKKCKVSRPTIDKYLSGDVAKIDIAEKLIVFFTSKVNHRIERLRKVNVA